MKHSFVGAVALAVLLVLPLRRPPGVLLRSVVRLPGTTGSLARLHQGSLDGASPLLRAVPVRGAVALAVDEDTRRVFVTCEFCYRGTGSVNMLDARTGAILRTVRIGKFPLAVAVDATTGRVFVGNEEPNSVSVLDAQSGRLLRTVPLAGDPDMVSVAARAGRVFVTYGHGNTVSVLDARTGTLRSTVTLHGGPFTLAVAERAERVFVGALRDTTLSVLDARSGTVLYTRHVGTIGTGALPDVAAVDEHAGHVFSDQGDILDARTGRVLHAGQIPNGTLAMTLNERTQQVFAVSGDTVTVLDARTGGVRHSSLLDAAPVSAPTVIPSTGRVAVLLAAPTSGSGVDVVGPSTLLVLGGSTGAVRRRFAMGGMYFGALSNYNLIAVDAQTKRVFVLDGDGVAVLDANRV